MSASHLAVFSYKNKKPRIKPLASISNIEITLLGCGTSSGVPLLACKCSTCRSKNPKNTRSRASVYIRIKNKGFLIDTSPDLRFQALANNIRWIDSVLYTHPHADHIHGIDELRSFNFVMGRTIPCYGNQWTIETIRHRFSYIFEMSQIGGGKPAIDLHQVQNKPFRAAGIPITPLPLIHGNLPVLGFRIKDVAYITDCSYIPDKTFKDLKNLKVLILDCLRPKKHSTHMNIEESLAWAKKIGAKKTFFTHMGHEIEYQKFARSLPKSMLPGFDGLKIKVT